MCVVFDIFFPGYLYCSEFGKNEYADVDWDNLGFGLVPTDYMYMMKCSNNGKFEQGQINRYKNIELNPAAGVLNYGQGIYEGLKAFRKEDGNLLLFRPDQNAMRMKIGAERMCMLSPSLDQFIDGVKQTVQANKCWVFFIFILHKELDLCYFNSYSTELVYR